MQGDSTTTPPRTPAAATRKLRILIVDDDQDSVDLLTQWLTMGGYEVTSAGDGQEALRRVPADRPDLVLLDLAIPPPDGMQVMRAIKRDRVCMPSGGGMARSSA
jgi:CheY-like chemotaxis protein